MNQQPTVEILLATYNGERYLNEQLHSLFAQSYRHWRLLVRDDLSSDATVRIIDAYAEQYPGKIARVADNLGRLGPQGNFSRLLELCDAPYLMFCDQDDVWLPNKIAKTLERMHLLEASCPEAMPLLVYTDMRVVDAQLATICESNWRYYSIYPESASTVSRLMLECPTSGCTLMINRALRDLAVPVPAEAIMHDWWITLVARAFGRIGCVSEATMLYRQHGRNTVGTFKSGISRIRARLAQLDVVVRELDATRTQAARFYERYAHRLDPQSKACVQAHAYARKHPLPQRKCDLLRYRFRKTGLVRNLGLALLF